MMAKLALRADLGVVALLVATIMLMIVPLPTALVDMLIAANMGLGVLLLMTAFYLQSPVQFSTLPAVILITTIFRLSLSIAVTRLVLTEADAGDIIRTFGDFVVAGNILVGLVIFMIITVVQFLVITKGAERIAEVAARFTLDAMPGKQMAIDADMRAGEIDQATGRARRRALEQESQLYGAMDGAMKFVKGDAIAGLIIIVINLVGGLVVGVLQHGMSFAEAGRTYTILTVGDGLVAQIPALFISITAGVVVTRVAGGEADSLGGEIALQLGHSSRALWLAACIALMLGLIPGFPAWIFLALAGVFALLARRARRRDTAAAEHAAPRPAVPPPPARVQIQISPSLARDIPTGLLQTAIARASVGLARQLGVPIPAAEVQEAALPDRHFRIDLDGIPLAEGEIPAASLLLRDNPAHAELAGVTPVPGRAMPGLQDTRWLAASARATLQRAGVGFLDPAEALALATSAALRRHATQLIGLQEAKQILTAAEAHWGELVREVLRLVPAQRSADLFRRLLDDGLDLRNLRGLLESMLECAQREQDPAGFAETVRASLRRQICHANADPLRVIAAIVVDADAEQTLRAAAQQGATALKLAEGTLAALVERVRAEIAASRGPSPVVLTAMDIRRHMRALLASHGVHAPVLSFHDLVPDYTVQTLGTVRLAGSAPVDRLAPQAEAA
jgi:type III secretion protein V